MVDITGTITGVIPEFGGSSTFNFITWLIISLIFIGIIGTTIWFILNRMKFNKKIIIWERINGQFEPTGKDRAREMKLSIGDNIFYIKKHNKYLPSPCIQTGRRTYYYWIRDDGEWINFKPGDFDEQARTLGAKFLDKEMRYARTQVQKGLKDRFDKPGFWKQYGLLVFSLVFIVVMGMMAWLLFDKWIEGLRVVPNILEKVEMVMERSETIIGKLNNACGQGPGYQTMGG